MIPFEYLVGEVGGYAVFIRACGWPESKQVSKWKVSWNGMAVSIEGRSIEDPTPSYRSEIFLRDYRFIDLDSAALAASRFIKREKGELFMESVDQTASSDLRNLLDRLGIVEKKVSVFENSIDCIIQDFEAALDKLRALNKSC